MIRPRTYLRRLGRNDDGSALVEFGMLAPAMLLFFAVAIEGGRTFWAYQTTIGGVRDAARYIGRAAPFDICEGGGNLNGYTGVLTDIVERSNTGTTPFPSTITVLSVTPSLECLAGDFRRDPSPIATVTAQLQITYPFQPFFAWMGIALPTATTSVTDSTRIFGS